jgi:hypothetical protein
LDAADTALHFGGGGGGASVYGPSGSNPRHGQRITLLKMELDDLIKQKGNIKAEKMKSSEMQVETVDKMDHSFKGACALLSFQTRKR